MPPKKKKVSQKASSSPREKKVLPRGKKASPRERKDLSEMSVPELLDLQGKAEEKLDNIKIKKRKGGEQKTFDTILADLSTGVDKISYMSRKEKIGEELKVNELSSNDAFKFILKFGDAISEDFCFAASEARRLSNDPEVKAIFDELDAIGVALKKSEKSPRKSSKKGSPAKEYLETVPGYPVAVQGYPVPASEGEEEVIYEEGYLPVVRKKVSLKGAARARKAGCGCSDRE